MEPKEVRYPQGVYTIAFCNLQYEWQMNALYPFR
mgnify:CR=1 FL=1